MPAPMANVPACTPRKAGRLNSETSSIGRSWRTSTTTKAASSSTPSTSEPTICALDQPASLPRSSAWTIRKSASREREEAGDVGARRSRVARLPQLPERDHEREHADGHVDEEDPAPAQRVGEDAAEQRPGRDGDADRRAPDRDRAPACSALILRSDQRERSGEQRSTADALADARDVERDDVPRGSAHERGDREDHDAGGEDEPAPEAIRERTGCEDQRGKRDCVRVDNPLKPSKARVELPLNARQSDVHDRDVDQQHERRRAHGDERPPAPLKAPLHRAEC